VGSRTAVCSRRRPPRALPAVRRMSDFAATDLLGLKFNKTIFAFSNKKKNYNSPIKLIINNKGTLIQWTCILTLRAPDPPVF
jgi:hypothetical protein